MTDPAAMTEHPCRLCSEPTLGQTYDPLLCRDCALDELFDQCSCDECGRFIFARWVEVPRNGHAEECSKATVTE